MNELRFMTFRQRLAAVAVMLVTVALFSAAPIPSAAEQTFDETSFAFGRFGTVAVYKPAAAPRQGRLFVSGDGVWNLSVLLAGVDTSHYLRALYAGAESCECLATDFEALGQYLQKRQGLPASLAPVLAGNSSGATLVFGELAQAPPDTSAAAVTMGFCPELALGITLCLGHGLKAKPRAGMANLPFGQALLPTSNLHNPCIAFQGRSDQVCAVADAGLADLPLVEVAARAPTGDTLAVIVSGAGGWTSIDRELGDELARRGVAVVGLNAMKYLWTPRQSETLGRDLSRILLHYLPLLGKRRVVLIGYSLGAEVLPFMASRLPTELLARVDAVVLIGPGERASFEFHLSDWLGGVPTKDSVPVLPEVEKLHGPRIICIRGSEETDSPCRGGSAVEPWQTIVLPGGHHFGGHYRALADQVMPGSAAASPAPASEQR